MDTTRSFWLGRYKATVPDSGHLLRVIHITLSDAFGFRFTMVKSSSQRVDFRIDDLWFSIDIQPERKSALEPTWKSGDYNHNGRWKLTLEGPSVRPLVRRPTEKQVAITMQAFVNHVGIALDVNHVKIALGRDDARKPTLRLVVDNTRN